MRKLVPIERQIKRDLDKKLLEYFTPKVTPMNSIALPLKKHDIIKVISKKLKR
jgi:hypothetical protein